MTHEASDIAGKSRARRMMRRASMVTLVLSAAVVGPSGARLAQSPSAPGALDRDHSFGPEPAATTSDLVTDGELAPSALALVSSVMAGRIEQVLVEAGATVRRGDPMAQLETSFLDLAVKRARADAAAAQRTLERARSRAVWTAAELARVGELLTEDFAVRTDYEVAEATLAAARAEEALARSNLAQAQLLVEQAELNLRHAEITAPVSGVVLARGATVGQLLSGTSADPPLFLIAQDLQRLRIHTRIGETVAQNVRADSRVTFVTKAQPLRRFDGTVRYVGDDAKTVSGVVTYGVVIDVDNREGALKPGMTVRVTFDNVLDAYSALAPKAFF